MSSEIGCFRDWNEQTFLNRLMHFGQWKLWFVLHPLVSAKELIKQYSSENEYLKIIGHCREGKKEALPSILKNRAATNVKILILIGPEGDFSPEEIQCATNNGFIEMHMGNSRLRTETAALTATTAVYLNSL